MRPSTDRTKAPKMGESIVWRFRGNKGWQRGHVRSVVASGRIFELANPGGFGDQLVSVRDIEWYLA